MIKRITLSTLVLAILAAFSLPLYAQQAFFRQQVGNWLIVGLPSQEGKNAVCGAEYGFGDGSRLTVYSDLVDGELYLALHNTRWNIGDEPNSRSQLRVNFIARNGHIKGAPAEFIIINKNTIIIPNVNAKAFIPDFMDRHKLEFVMPGTITNAEIPLDNSTRAVEMLIKCVDAGSTQAPPAKKKKETDA